MFARSAPMRYAMRLIILSWFLTRFSFMLFPDFTFGYFAIDVLLGGAFLHHWQSTGRVILLPLVCIQASFLILHILGHFFDFSGAYLGAERNDLWVQEFWRNRLFELSLVYVAFISGLKITIINMREGKGPRKKLKEQYSFFRPHR